MGVYLRVPLFRETTIYRFPKMSFFAMWDGVSAEAQRIRVRYVVPVSVHDGPALSPLVHFDSGYSTDKPKFQQQQDEEDSSNCSRGISHHAGLSREVV